jgi:hypothetical protein
MQTTGLNLYTGKEDKMVLSHKPVWCNYVAFFLDFHKSHDITTLVLSRLEMMVALFEYLEDRTEGS